MARNERKTHLVLNEIVGYGEGSSFFRRHWRRRAFTLSCLSKENRRNVNLLDSNKARKVVYLYYLSAVDQHWFFFVHNFLHLLRNKITIHDQKTLETIKLCLKTRKLKLYNNLSSLTGISCVIFTRDKRTSSLLKSASISRSISDIISCSVCLMLSCSISLLEPVPEDTDDGAAAVTSVHGCWLLESVSWTAVSVGGGSYSAAVPIGSTSESSRS